MNQYLGFILDNVWILCLSRLITIRHLDRQTVGQTDRDRQTDIQPASQGHSYVLYTASTLFAEEQLVAHARLSFRVNVS